MKKEIVLTPLQAAHVKAFQEYECESGPNCPHCLTRLFSVLPAFGDAPPTTVLGKYPFPPVAGSGWQNKTPPA